MKALPQVSRDLLEAARIVEKGWCQNETHIDDKFCVMGALAEVTDGGFFRGPCENRFMSAIDAVAGLLDLGPQTVFHSQHPLADWNDAPERTKAEVVKALQDAAMKAAEEMGNEQLCY